MRAAQITRFGQPGGIAINEVQVPEPRAGEVLVRVAACSINSVDVDHARGRLRLLAGSRVPQGLGIDLVGTVESAGRAVSSFAAGDRVWGIRAGICWPAKPGGPRSRVLRD